MLLSRHFASANSATFSYQLSPNHCAKTLVLSHQFCLIIPNYCQLLPIFPNYCLAPDFLRQSFRRRYLTASSCSVMTAACSGRHPSLGSVSSISSPSLLRNISSCANCYPYWFWEKRTKGPDMQKHKIHRYTQMYTDTSTRRGLQDLAGSWKAYSALNCFSAFLNFGVVCLRLSVSSFTSSFYLQLSSLQS